MERNKQARLLEQIEAFFDELEVKSQRVPAQADIQVGDSLQALLPVSDQGDVVIMEIMMAGLTEQADFVQFFTTIVMEGGPGYEALIRADESMNFVCPLGAFGAFEQQRQFYHKYGLLLNKEAELPAITQDVKHVIDIIATIIAQRFDVIAQLSEGTLTYDDAVEQKLL